jgi:hypothetical protein
VTFAELISSMSSFEKAEKYLRGMKTLRIRSGVSRMARTIAGPNLVDIRSANVIGYFLSTCKELSFIL